MKMRVVVTLLLALFVTGCSVNLPWFPHNNEEYIISGRVVDRSGTGVSGVTVLTDTGLSDVTARNGTFVFTQLKGTVTVTPQRTGYEFSPESIVVQREKTNIEFVMYPEGEQPPEPQYVIAGRVVDPTGRGVSGVVVSAQQKETVTSTDGSWELDGLRGEATVTFSKPGMQFQPERHIVKRATRNLRNEALTVIMGEPVVSQSQALRFLMAKNVPSEFWEVVEYYYEFAPLYGIRADVALAQSILETGYYSFTGDAEAWQNNFAGIGVTGRKGWPPTPPGGDPLYGADPTRVWFEDDVHGAIFLDKPTGVEAQIQHLWAYANKGKLPVARPLLSPRFNLIGSATRGSAPYVEWLGAEQNPSGTGWATDEEYGFKIINVLHAMQTY